MSHPKVLVTGGAGFIGSHLCERLLKAKIKPLVLDNLSVGKLENIPRGCEFIKGDIGNFSLIKKVVSEVEAVFHLAANVTVRGSVEKFYEDAQTNIMGTLNLLRACQKNRGVKSFIYSSSMAVYADSKKPWPINEDYQTRPISPYGVAKLASERYVLLACQQMGIKPVILRYFNTYGPRQTVSPYVGVITIFINKLLANQPLTIFGDGEQRRDFVYVKDIAEANYQVFKHKVNGEVFNVGTGVATSVNQIAKLLRGKINPAGKIEYLPPHPGELRNSVADSSKLEKFTGFRPKVKLEEKIEETINFIRRP